MFVVTVEGGGDCFFECIAKHLGFPDPKNDKNKIRDQLCRFMQKPDYPKAKDFFDFDFNVKREIGTRR